MNFENTTQNKSPEEKYQEGAHKLNALTQEIHKVIIGQESIIHKLLIGLFTGGHVLLEGVPGLAKTSIIKAIAQCTGAEFKRIQFTPDLLPADLIGTLIYNQHTAQFTVRKGPIFTDIVLADEINRAPSKVQSALLECMQEKQVSIGGETHLLNPYFWVLATENPIEHEGTYSLPEAQLDRFMLKLKIDYPSIEEEKRIILHSLEKHQTQLTAILKQEDLSLFQELIHLTYIDPSILEYILLIIRATRNPQECNLNPAWLSFGASPRASIFLALASKGMALLNARDHVTPDDVKNIAHDVLRHRIIVSYEGEAEDKTSDQILTHILEHIPVP